MARLHKLTPPATRQEDRAPFTTTSTQVATSTLEEKLHTATAGNFFSLPPTTFHWWQPTFTFTPFYQPALWFIEQKSSLWIRQADRSQWELTTALLHFNPKSAGVQARVGVFICTQGENGITLHISRPDEWYFLEDLIKKCMKTYISIMSSASEYSGQRGLFQFVLLE